jgi:acyl carrier protein
MDAAALVRLGSMTAAVRNLFSTLGPRSRVPQPMIDRRPFNRSGTRRLPQWLEDDRICLSVVASLEAALGRRRFMSGHRCLHPNRLTPPSKGMIEPDPRTIAMSRREELASRIIIGGNPQMLDNNLDLVLEEVSASIRGAGWRDDSPVLASDAIEDLGLSRLRLLAALIELEEKFGIELPSDAIDGFRIVGDIALYIQAHEMTPYDDTADEFGATVGQPMERRLSARDCLNWICARTFGRIPGMPGLAGG